MKIFASAIENNNKWIDDIRKENPNFRMKWNLMSYYYIKGKPMELIEWIRDASDLIMIDSGAHSFQKGKKVDWDSYTREYAEFIKKFDRPNVVGYFEMDVDNIIGYDKVLELRKVLESVSDKIIPVWHKNRGVAEYKKMCKDYAGKVVAITGFRNGDIKDDQYIMFLKYAKRYGCKVHCLGMTRKQILDKVPFDYTDSSSWVQDTVYGRIGRRKVTMEMSKTNRQVIFAENYKLIMEKQDYYHKKWRKVCQD